MKKVLKKITLTALFLIPASMLLCATIDLNAYKNAIAKISDYKAQAASKEKALSVIRVSPAGSGGMWNFYSRMNSEQAMLKRARLSRDLNDYKDKISAEKKFLLADRQSLAQNFEKYVNLSDFNDIMNFMDSLEVDELAGYKFIDYISVSRQVPKEDRSFLAYKAQTQAERLKAMEDMVKYLEFKKEALKKAKLSQYAVDIDSQLDKIRGNIAIGQASQTNIEKLLGKTKK